MYFLLKILPYAFVAAIAASIGSFYQTLADRILYLFYGPGRKAIDKNGRRFALSTSEKYRSLFLFPSSCSSCNVRISPLYLIPIFGWIFAKGRCSNCDAPISVSHILIEVGFALLGVVFLFLSKSVVLTLILLFFSGHLLVSMITDWHHLILDYENTAVLFLLSVLYVYFSDGEFLYHFYSFAGVALFFLIAFILTKGRQPGFGDILLAAVLGFVHGFPWVLVPLQVGAAGSILHLWLVNRDFKSAAPLGFYLSIGSILTFVVSFLLG